MRFLAAASAALFLSTVPVGVAHAQAANSTVTLPDGTTIVTTIAGLNNINIKISGGPYTATPAEVQFTSVVPSAGKIDYTGTITQGGTSLPFTCQLDTQTQAVTGSGACATAFGQSSGTTTPPPTTPTTPTPPTTPTTPTPPTTPPVVTPTPGGGSTTTATLPNGTVITISLPQKALITEVEADQLVLALLGDRMTASSLSGFVSNRVAALSFAGMASGGAFTANGRGDYRGVNAGGSGVQRGVWVNASGSFIDDKRPGSAQDGFGGSAAIGGDLIFDTAIVGAYAGYGSTELDGALVDYKARGWSGGAYASWSASPLFRVTGTIGAGSHDVEYGRQAGALRSHGKTDRNQVFGSISFESQLELGQGWVAVPSLGVIASSSDTDGYVDSGGLPIGAVKSDLTTLQAGGAVFYTASAWLPYVSASFNSQTDDVPGVDGDYALLGAGFAAPLSDDLSLGVSVQTMVGKKNERETSFGATLRKAF